ncbi:MAG: extracellular solute-binding protein [Candidatus Endonucleobacter sp. (ex Gigantidas childressi)]|nr:extracellular solute-binding protein [Candidatus Endonucleobacter sp. (ex Gigantidas childressi)]
MLATKTSTLSADPTPAHINTQYSLPLIGKAAYPDDFKHFDYVNPNAPKRGTLTLAEIGTYDTLNQYAGKGQPAGGLYLLYDCLMIRSADEPYTLYPLLAKSIQYPDNLQWVAFNLDARARFHDGKPVTANDVAFSFNLLKESGSPFVKSNCADVLSAKAESHDRVVFHLKSERGIKVLAFIAFLPVMPAHFWKGRAFNAALTSPPMGSGPMKVNKTEFGRSITYERVQDYWAKNLPVNKGKYNFDRVRIDYYRDVHASIEAFRAGLYDFRYELDAKSWNQNYNFPAVKKGDVITESAPLLHTFGTSAFVFNTRKSIFQDPLVRSALLQLFDFDWVNKYLLYSECTRTTSFFSKTPLAATGLPSKYELALLEPFRQYLPTELFSKSLPLTVSADVGSRKHKQEVVALLQEAGWELKDGIMMQKKTGIAMIFSLLQESAEDERMVALFRKNLSEIGIKMNIKTLDTSRFRKRVKTFDFDMVNWRFIHSTFPGLEQANSWSGDAAERYGSNNLAGVKNPAADALTDQLRRALDYKDIINITKALDRVLLWGYYVIPKWHSNQIHMAYWKHYRRPKTGEPFYPVIEAMWFEGKPKS